MKSWFYICAVVVFLAVTCVGFAQEQQDIPETQSNQGIVTQVDSVSSLLVVFDGSQQVRFNVAPGAKIQSGTEDIMLDEIELNDSVTVEYYKTPDGLLKAVSIIDNNLAAGY